jgi:hypothetical protein
LKSRSGEAAGGAEASRAAERFFEKKRKKIVEVLDKESELC